MASTNKTSNYELSQFIGTDKPTFLGDYNGDMLKIDTQMKTNADNVATAISTANSATSTANTASSTASSALSTANTASSTATSANTTAGNAQTTANSALSTATTAQNTANSALSLAEKMSFTTFKNVANADISFSNGATLDNNSLSIASNSDGSMAKVYGSLTITNTNRNTGKITITSSLRPTDDKGDPVDLTINGVMIRIIGVNQANKNVNMASLVIKGNGNIEIDILQVNSSVTEQDRYLLTACNLYLKPFSDTPIPE